MFKSSPWNIATVVIIDNDNNKCFYHTDCSPHHYEASPKTSWIITTLTFAIIITIIIYSSWSSWITMIKHCQASGWLKTFGQFWCLGGGVVHDWCKPGVWPFFVHRLAGVGKPLFWCQISIFWWKVGAENPFFGVQNAFFGVRKLWWNFLRVSMKLPGKHGGGEVNDVCVFISPPCTKTGQTFKANQGISKQIIVFQTVLGFVLSSIFTWQLYTQAQGRKNDRHRVSALCHVWHGFEWVLPTWQCISAFRKIKNHPNAHQRRHIAVKITRNHSTLQNPSKPLQIFPNPPNPQKSSPIFPNHQKSPETFPKPKPPPQPPQNHPPNPPEHPQTGPHPPQTHQNTSQILPGALLEV